MNAQHPAFEVTQIRSKFWLGFWYVPGCHLLSLIFLGLLAFVSSPRLSSHGMSITQITDYFFLLLLFFHACFLGLSQIVYVLPAVVIAWRKRRFDFIRGMLITAAITIVLDVIFLATQISHFKTPGALP